MSTTNTMWAILHKGTSLKMISFGDGDEAVIRTTDFCKTVKEFRFSTEEDLMDFGSLLKSHQITAAPGSDPEMFQLLK